MTSVGGKSAGQFNCCICTGGPRSGDLGRGDAGRCHELDCSISGDNTDGTVLVPEEAIGVEVHGEVRTDGENNISSDEGPGLQMHSDGTTVGSQYQI